MWMEVLLNVKIIINLFAHIKHWMKKIWSYLLINHLKLSEFWNMDEIGIQIFNVYYKKIIMCQSCVNFNHQCQAPSNKENVTLIKYYLLNNRFILLLIIMHKIKTQLN